MFEINQAYLIILFLLLMNLLDINEILQKQLGRVKFVFALLLSIILIVFF